MQHSEKGPTSSSGKGHTISDARAFQNLDETILAELEEICAEAVYQPGKMVSEDRVIPDHVCILAQGVLRIQKTLFNGRQQIVGLMFEGDLFGYTTKEPMSFAIEAVSKAVIFRLDRSSFEAILSRSPELQQILLNSILTDIDRARDWMVVLSNYRTKARLAGFLAVLCTRYPCYNQIVQSVSDRLILRIPVNRSDLSSLLGTRVETISRAFGALAKMGIIEITKPNLIEVLDIQALFFESGYENVDELEV